MPANIVFQRNPHFRSKGRCREPVIRVFPYPFKKGLAQISWCFALQFWTWQAVKEEVLILAELTRNLAGPTNWRSPMNRVAPSLFLAIGLLVVAPAAAQDDSIAGVWRAREESASGIFPGVNAKRHSDDVAQPFGSISPRDRRGRRRRPEWRGRDDRRQRRIYVRPAANVSVFPPQLAGLHHRGLRTGTADRAKYWDVAV
jgi:hypothetical protein